MSEVTVGTYRLRAELGSGDHALPAGALVRVREVVEPGMQGVGFSERRTVLAEHEFATTVRDDAGEHNPGTGVRTLALEEHTFTELFEVVEA